MLAKANLTGPVRREFVPALAFRARFPQPVDPSSSLDFVMPAESGAALQAFAA